MYAPTLGRFMRENPIRYNGGDPNVERYVGNNPTNATDPSGLKEEELTVKITDAKFIVAHPGYPHQLTLVFIDFKDPTEVKKLASATATLYIHAAYVVNRLNAHVGGKKPEDLLYQKELDSWFGIGGPGKVYQLKPADHQTILGNYKTILKFFLDKEKLYYIRKGIHEKNPGLELRGAKRDNDNAATIEVYLPFWEMPDHDKIPAIYHELTHILLGTKDDGYLKESYVPGAYLKPDPDNPKKFIPAIPRLDELLNNADTYRGYWQATQIPKGFTIEIKEKK